MLAHVLALPMEVYKEVQIARFLSLSVTCADDLG